MTLKLCKECDIKEYCKQTCQDAIKHEIQDNKGNYQPAADYKAKGTSTTFYDMRRGQGGINRFK